MSTRSASSRDSARRTGGAGGGGGAPSGPAGGQLAGTYPNPVVVGVTETSGPDALDIGDIADGEFVKRVGSELVGVPAPSGGGYDTIENNGTPVTQRSTVNLSTEFLATDAGGKTALALAAAGVGFSKLANLAGNSVLGRAAGTAGAMAAITAGTDGVLRESGGVLAFGSLVNANIDAAAAIAVSKLANLAGVSVLGRAAGTAGAMAAITAGTDQVLRESGGALGFGTVNTGGITNKAVTYAKIQDITATQRVLGRNTAGAGVTEEVTASQVLDWIGSTRGAALYRGAAGWTALAPGAAGSVIVSAGAGADPAYSTRMLFDNGAVSLTVGDTSSGLPLTVHLKSGTDQDLTILLEENGHSGKPWYYGIDASDGHKFVIGHGSSTLGGGVVSFKIQSGTGDIEYYTDLNFKKSGTQIFSKEGTGSMIFRSGTGQEISFRPGLREALLLKDGTSSVNVALVGNGSASFGSGDGVVFIGNVTTAPSSDPSAGGIMYAESGALKWRGSSGTVTTIAPA